MGNAIESDLQENGEKHVVVNYRYTLNGGYRGTALRKTALCHMAPQIYDVQNAVERYGLL